MWHSNSNNWFSGMNSICIIHIIIIIHVIIHASSSSIVNSQIKGIQSQTNYIQLCSSSSRSYLVNSPHILLVFRTSLHVIQLDTSPRLPGLFPFLHWLDSTWNEWYFITLLFSQNRGCYCYRVIQYLKGTNQITPNVVYSNSAITVLISCGFPTHSRAWKPIGHNSEL